MKKVIPIAQKILKQLIQKMIKNLKFDKLILLDPNFFLYSIYFELKI